VNKPAPAVSVPLSALLWSYDSRCRRTPICDGRRGSRQRFTR